MADELTPLNEALEEVATLAPLKAGEDEWPKMAIISIAVSLKRLANLADSVYDIWVERIMR